MTQLIVIPSGAAPHLRCGVEESLIDSISSLGESEILAMEYIAVTTAQNDKQ